MKKVKWKSTEQKKIERENQQAWNALLNKWKPSKLVVADPPKYKLGIPEHRKQKQYQSITTGAADTFKHTPQQYTGDKVIGIGVMHKSCLVPIFNSEQATDLAKMRR